MAQDHSVPDHDTQHLFPDFARIVEAVLAEANHECKQADGTAKFPGFKEWRVFEGYRSVDRQLWLYGQGRPSARPYGRAGSKVTAKRTPDHHSYGLAADVVWLDAHGSPHWDGAEELWATLGHCARAQGLEWGGDWDGKNGRPKFPDKPHIQPKAEQMARWQPEARTYLHKLGLTTPA